MPAVKRLIGCLILPVFFVTAWDIAVITNNEIEFLQDEKFVGVSSGNLKELTSGSYDPVRGELYVSDSNKRNASLFRVSTFSSKNETGFLPIVSKQQFVVKGIVFEPVTNALFWSTGNGHTIYKMFVNHSSEQIIQSGEVLHEFSVEIPLGIAVDSCEQFLYWTNGNINKPTIERSRTDGTNREIIVDTNLFQPWSIVVDQRESKIYWSNEGEGIFYSIERADLDGANRETVIHSDHHQPVSLSLVGEKVFWIDLVGKNLYSLPKNSSNKVREPQSVKNFKNKNLIGLISNSLYLNTDPEKCPLLAPLKDKIDQAYTNSQSFVLHEIIHEISSSNATDISFRSEYCLNNGTLLEGVCKCRKGYSGTRCEISMCHNYCVRGTCEIDIASEPTCHCPTEYSGVRCEIDKCHGMCLNSGTCTLDNNNEPSCECRTGFSGDRCEFLTDVIGELCKTYCEYNDDTSRSSQSTTVVYEDLAARSGLLHVCSCSGKKSSAPNDRYERLADDTLNQNQHLVSELNSRFSVLVTSSLGLVCIILAVTVIILTSKVYMLKKRPRIRKRIIVNKPPAPFACRPQAPPEQCEITIENCCNMNICETPCFEPDFRSSKAAFKKSKSEDKRMLIGSIHSSSSQDEENY